MPTYSSFPTVGAEFKSNTSDGGSVPARFDCFLYKPDGGFDQLKLTIKLRINLRQLAPRLLPLVLDAGDKPFWTSPWDSPSWKRFLNAASAQADVWNRKFWLIPPANFTKFDNSVYGSPDKVFRPNIQCQLDVDFAPSSDAHATIDVANLDLSKLVGKTQNSGTFRSHSLLYDSLDGTPYVFSFEGGTPNYHYTIAHEIGHSIGLDHIGVMRKLPLCDLAIALENVDQRLLPPTLTGGTNAYYCYGSEQGMKHAGNIMGAGSNFAVENAVPWQWSAALLHAKLGGGGMAFWQVVTANPGPGRWVNA